MCIFCNDELALERIEIILLDDFDEIHKQLLNFKIDEAHCYDPNEEYKLRYIFDMAEKVGHKNLLNKSIQLIKKKLNIVDTVTRIE